MEKVISLSQYCSKKMKHGEIKGKSCDRKPDVCINEYKEIKLFQNGIT